jgi:hypothetical protein
MGFSGREQRYHCPGRRRDFRCLSSIIRQGVVFPRSKERDPEVVAQYRGVDITVGLPSVRIRIDPSVGSFPV